MKKIILLTLFLSIANISYAQETTNEEQTDKYNELKLNVSSLLMRVIELDYERILSDETSIGLTLGGSVSPSEDYNFSRYNFMIMPYFRIYLGRKKAINLSKEPTKDYKGNGWFIAVNGAVFSQTINLADILFEEPKLESRFGVGLGLFGGYKFLTQSRWVIELSGGGVSVS